MVGLNLYDEVGEKYHYQLKKKLRKNILIKFTDFGPAEAFLPAFMKAALTPRIPHTPRKKNT